MEAYWESRSIAPCIIDLDTRWILLYIFNLYVFREETWKTRNSGEDGSKHSANLICSVNCDFVLYFGDETQPYT